jgi:hypothetical protein
MAKRRQKDECRMKKRKSWRRGTSHLTTNQAGQSACGFSHTVTGSCAGWWMRPKPLLLRQQHRRTILERRGAVNDN